MIADLLPRYRKKVESNVRYDVVRSIVIDGHEVAWMKWEFVEYDADRRSHGYDTYCECDFTEGISWNSKGDNLAVRYSHNARSDCLNRRAALHLRQLELRREYCEKFSVDPTDSGVLQDYVQEITLDLIKKGQAGEWIEDSGDLTYEGRFYMQTLEAITDVPERRLRKDVTRLERRGMIRTSGWVIMPSKPLLWFGDSRRRSPFKTTNHGLY